MFGNSAASTKSLRLSFWAFCYFPHLSFTLGSKGWWMSGGETYRNRKKMNRLFFSLLLSAGLAHADFNSAQWHSRAPLNVTPGHAVSEFTVTADVFRHSSAQLNDLRIIRDGVTEVPYIV